MKRLIIVGDIHGCFAELLELLDRVGFGSEDTLLSVGDLVDRGPESVEVVNFFRTQPNALALMGNHERKHVRGVFSYSQEITRLQFAEVYEDARKWLSGLPYYFETEAVRVVHAAMQPGVPLHQQREEVLCGSAAGEKLLSRQFPEGRYWHEFYADDKPIVFGHHVVGPEPLVRNNLVFGIDTGACHGMRLTALSVPDFKLYSVSAREDHWKSVMRRFQLPVLQSRPWATTAFRDFAEKTAEFRDCTEPEVRAFLSSLSGWAEALQRTHEALLPAIVEEAGRIRNAVGEAEFGKAVRNHPAASLLFQERAGRLDLSVIRTSCSTPQKTIALATQFEIPVPPQP